MRLPFLEILHRPKPPLLWDSYHRLVRRVDFVRCMSFNHRIPEMNIASSSRLGISGKRETSLKCKLKTNAPSV